MASTSVLAVTGHHWNYPKLDKAGQWFSPVFDLQLHFRYENNEQFVVHVQTRPV